MVIQLTGWVNAAAQLSVEVENFDSILYFHLALVAIKLIRSDFVSQSLLVLS